MPEPGGQSCGKRGSAGDTDLLAENRAHAQLEAVPGAGDTQPGSRFDQLSEQRVTPETRIDG